jgi:hypothetical protein
MRPQGPGAEITTGSAKTRLTPADWDTCRVVALARMERP